LKTHFGKRLKKVEKPSLTERIDMSEEKSGFDDYPFDAPKSTIKDSADSNELNRDSHESSLLSPGMDMVVSDGQPSENFQIYVKQILSYSLVYIKEHLYEKYARSEGLINFNLEKDKIKFNQISFHENPMNSPKNKISIIGVETLIGLTSVGLIPYFHDAEVNVRVLTETIRRKMLAEC
jgi:hypothetical protein